MGRPLDPQYPTESNRERGARLSRLAAGLEESTEAAAAFEPIPPAKKKPAPAKKKAKK